jgi:hypothetical protein
VITAEMPEQGATYTFEDLSGNHAASSDDPNPYNALIKSCNNDPVRERDTMYEKEISGTILARQ